MAFDYQRLAILQRVWQGCQYGVRGWTAMPPTRGDYLSSTMRSMRRSGSAAPHSSWSPTVKADR